MATSAWTYQNSSSTDTATDTNGCWVAWNTSTGSTLRSTDSTDATWYYWNVDSTSDTGDRTAVIVHNGNEECWTSWNTVTFKVIEGNFDRKPEKRRERLRFKRQERKRILQMRKMRAREAIRQLEKAKSEEKAKELLLDLIGPEQMEVYNRTGRVFVKGRQFDWLLETEGHRCRLTKITKDKVHDLCIHMEHDSIPKTDQVIGYMLQAKHNEEHLVKTANLVRVNDRKNFEERIKEAANV